MEEQSLDQTQNIENVKNHTEASDLNEDKEIEKSNENNIEVTNEDKYIDEGKQNGVTEETLSQKDGVDSDKNSTNNQEMNEMQTQENKLNPSEENKEETGQETVEEEEDAFIEEPPPDPAAPLNLSDSKEAFKEPFALRPDQLAEVEQLWEYFQNYTPAYADLENYITEKELIYMLKSLLLMTYTLDQFQELIDFCVRPSHPEGHITFDQFLKIVTIRQRDLPVEEELRSALHALDPGKAGVIDREFMREVLSKQGHKMPPKLLDNLMKEVDISNDGTIGIEDVVGTMCIDLNKDDILMLLASLNPESQEKKEDDF